MSARGHGVKCLILNGLIKLSQVALVRNLFKRIEMSAVGDKALFQYGEPNDHIQSFSSATSRA
jgi:hypothetical protein